LSKYKTIAIDSASEWARLTFAKAMGKSAKDLEKIRQVNDYPGTTERINMVVRRMKDYKTLGINVVITAHEQIEKVYARGGVITPKGQPVQEPIAVKGMPDLPGRTCPEEVMRAVDNVFHVRRVNGKTTWIARPEALGGGGDDWVVKDRFNATQIMSGLLPADYAEVAKLAAANPSCNWNPPYLTLIYGTAGIGKTRSLLTFPRPIYIIDVDRGTESISKEAAEPGSEITIERVESEDTAEYDRFVKLLEAAAHA
jgi:hypothetical protein